MPPSGLLHLHGHTVVQRFVNLRTLSAHPPRFGRTNRNATCWAAVGGDHRLTDHPLPSPLDILAVVSITRCALDSGS